jgi:hypothetical protein
VGVLLLALLLGGCDGGMCVWLWQFHGAWLMGTAGGRGVPSIPGIAAPVIGPGHTLDNGTGSNPVSSHPVGYGTWLSVLGAGDP